MNIELTDRQVNPMSPILKKLQEDNLVGKPGAVMRVGYLDHERTLKVQEVLGGRVGDKTPAIYADIVCPY